MSATLKATSHHQDLQQYLDQEGLSALWPADSECLQAWSRVLLASDFARQQLPKRAIAAARLEALLKGQLSEGLMPEPSWLLLDESEFMQRLRRWRNETMLSILVRDVNGQSAEQTCWALSALADQALTWAEQYSHQQQASRYGEPGLCPHSGQPQRLLVLSMGKHGAQELNFSSDIDLIFAYSGAGNTQGEQSISHEEFFTRLGRQVIRVLDQMTVDGFVFRVDLRLRPWGQSGPLVCSQDFLADYYHSQGRDWERFAMIKARVVTGPLPARQALEASLREFCFRPYVDFRIMDALREMKRMISKEVRRRGNQHNIKLGQGGIREIEFIVQAVQLIRGGQDKQLQQRNIFQLFKVLKQDYLPEQVVLELAQDYSLLRDTEHLLQGFADRQTQDLVTQGPEAERLALAAGYESPSAWLATIDAARQRVTAHFDNFIALDEQAQLPEQAQQLTSCWPQAQASVFAQFMQDAEQAEQLASWVNDFAQSNEMARCSEQAQSLLAQLMPRLLHEILAVQQSGLAWQRVQPILEAILRRSVYMSLLIENPSAVRQLVKLVVLSPWVSEHIASTPFLLDELTDPGSLYSLPKRPELVDELRQLMVRLPEDDLEQHMEVLRQFKRSRQLRAAACELTGALPLMKISDYLTWLAEAIVDQVLQLSWAQLVAKHGRPMKSADLACDPDFIIVAYGKLGGLELSYESDLDLVFIHNADAMLSTQGPKVVDNPVFFTRLGQKIIHYLSAMTPTGTLYEVDMRLRPSGNSGLLVTSLPAFISYQQQDAWTWEHQALCRARYIAGCSATRTLFEQARHAILATSRDEASLRQDVVAMREKMRQHLGSQAKGQPGFNLKQDLGGMVDIEFMVQFAVLSMSSKVADLSQWTDNMRVLDVLAKHELWPKQRVQDLQNAYLELRAIAHQVSLAKGSGLIRDEQQLVHLAPLRAEVEAAWQQCMLP